MPTSSGLAPSRKYSRSAASAAKAGPISLDPRPMGREPQVIRVDFTSGKTRPVTADRDHAHTRPVGSLSIGWLVNGAAALVTVLVALSSGNLPDALAYFLVGALAGLAAQGSAALVTLAPPRRSIQATAFGDEWLTAMAFLCLAISVVAAVLGLWAALTGHL